jgi:hypothetical protein
VTAGYVGNRGPEFPATTVNGRKSVMSEPTVGASVVRGLRLRLKAAHRRCGFVHGAWWPRSPHLTAELPALLAALSPRLGRIDRAIYDENGWAPTPLMGRAVFGRTEVILDGSSDQSVNTLSVIGEQFGRLVLLVVPSCTAPIRAYTALMASPEDVSTADELLGIGPKQAEDRRIALIARQRWESDGGALRRPGT